MNADKELLQEGQEADLLERLQKECTQRIIERNLADKALEAAESAADQSQNALDQVVNAKEVCQEVSRSLSKSDRIHTLAAALAGVRVPDGTFLQRVLYAEVVRQAKGFAAGSDESILSLEHMAANVYDHCSEGDSLSWKKASDTVRQLVMTLVRRALHEIAAEA